MQTARQLNYENDNVGYISEDTKKQVLKVVKKKKKTDNTHRKVMFKCLFMVAVLLVTMIGFTAYGTSIKYQINERNVEISKLQDDIETLNLKVTSNSSPAAIEQRAIAELGMEYPSAAQYVYLDSVSGDVTTADAN